MLTIALDGGSPDEIFLPLREQFAGLGIDVAVWMDPDPIPLGTNALVAHIDRVRAVKASIHGADQEPILIATSFDSSTEQSRALLEAGVVGNVPVAGCDVTAQVVAILAAATGAVDVVPHGHARTMAMCLDEPPRPLTSFEARFLSILATRTIEQAGAELGLSRRQTQRRFKQLCADLQLADRLSASVSAAHWGLVDTG